MIGIPHGRVKVSLGSRLREKRGVSSMIGIPHGRG